MKRVSGLFPSVSSSEIIFSKNIDFMPSTFPGTRLGFSVAGAAGGLLIGFGGNGILTARADVGGYFYLDRAYISDLDVPPLLNEPVLTRMSEELGCFGLQNELQCYAYNVTLFQRGQPMTEVFRRVSKVSSPVTTCKSTSPAGCFAFELALWKQSMAVVGQKDQSRFVTTYYLSSRSNWTCTSGCSGFQQGSVLSSNTNTWGKAVALGQDMLAIGDPYDNGKVTILEAKGAQDSTPYGQQRSWSMAAELNGPVLGNAFGATLSLSERFRKIMCVNVSVCIYIYIYI
jgi:hypothetical protein